MLTGKVHALVKDRHRSREFIELLRLIDAAYPPNTAIKLILDNHSAHISRETRAWLATRRWDASSSPSLPSTAHGSISSRGSSPSSPVQSSATSGWPQNTNSRSASWLVSTTSIAIRSSTHGPTNSPTPPDMIRTKKTLI
ncbi:hypothetical protein [Bradyrhizobium valentinum]|uniref:hypothetical protein n=1 Tax=Bradyrhizobium valentinum TaxID=1518501 RepID=UPI0030B85E4B